jgi:hypothetical protein
MKKRELSLRSAAAVPARVAVLDLLHLKHLRGQAPAAIASRHGRSQVSFIRRIAAPLAHGAPKAASETLDV